MAGRAKVEARQSSGESRGVWWDRALWSSKIFSFVARNLEIEECEEIACWRRVAGSGPRRMSRSGHFSYKETIYVRFVFGSDRLTCIVLSGHCFSSIVGASS